MAYELRTTVQVDAPPATVWSILVALDSYGEWNPFITSARGSVAVGERLENRLEPPGGKPVTFRPTITVVEPTRKLEWLGRFGVPGIFDGRHRFDLVPTESGTRVEQSEHFSGVLVPLLKRSLDTKTRAGFEAMNAALKTRAEAQERTV